jgi:hypothetical protein
LSALNHLTVPVAITVFHLLANFTERARKVQTGTIQHSLKLQAGV